MGSSNCTRAYRKGVLEAEGFPIEELSDYLDQPDTVVWVDICQPDAADLEQLADELDLHELAVEDALGAHQRPKVDAYASHLFVTARAMRIDPETAELGETEIDAFMSERWLITVRKDEGFPIARVTQRWDRSPELAVHGVSFLLYGLLDVVVDEYFGVIQAFDDFYDQVSDQIFADQPLDPAKQRHWFETRRALTRFHRVAVPMREVISSLMRRNHGAMPQDLYPYYQDVYDHILRVTEATDSLRDLVGTIVETNLSLRDYRQNQVMKRVTSWAAIIAVPTLITGYYGMNVPFPGDGETWGVVTASLLVVMVSGLLYLIFRRRDWL